MSVFISHPCSMNLRALLLWIFSAKRFNKFSALCDCLRLSLNRLSPSAHAAAAFRLECRKAFNDGAESQLTHNRQNSPNFHSSLFYFDCASLSADSMTLLYAFLIHNYTHAYALCSWVVLPLRPWHARAHFANVSLNVRILNVGTGAGDMRTRLISWHRERCVAL